MKSKDKCKVIPIDDMLYCKAGDFYCHVKDKKGDCRCNVERGECLKMDEIRNERGKK